MRFAEILILLVLILIFFQDVTSKSVYWFLFPVLAGLLLFAHWNCSRSFADVWPHCVFNLLFVALQLLILTAYFSVKSKKLVNITNNLLGIGDILFLLCVALYFSELNFVLFYIGSMIIVLLVWLAWQSTSKKEHNHIPLAGLQALIFAAVLASDLFIVHVHLTDDSWLTNLMMK